MSHIHDPLSRGKITPLSVHPPSATVHVPLLFSVALPTFDRICFFYLKLIPFIESQPTIGGGGCVEGVYVGVSMEIFSRKCHLNTSLEAANTVETPLLPTRHAVSIAALDTVFTRV